MGDRVAEVQHHHAIADAEHQAHVVIDEEHGDAVLVGQRAQAMPERDALIGVEPGGRLVHQNQTRLLRQRAADAHELALSVRDLAG